VEPSALAEIMRLTDALLAAVRLPNPDLEAVQQLLRQRGQLLASLPEPAPAERRGRVAFLQRIQAADAEIRGRLEERRALVRAELRAMARRAPRRQPPNRPSLLDQQV